VDEDFYHEPVLLNEAIGFLLHNKDSTRNKVYVDGTLGGGGYTGEVLKLTAKDTHIIAIDRDIFSIQYCKKYLKEYSDRIIFREDNFINIAEILESSLKKTGNDKISGFVLDLGLSTYQLNFEPGFSYQKDTELDMRADKSTDLRASVILNEYQENELEGIFKEYGELKYSKKIAKDIIAYRVTKEMKSTFDLVDAVKEKIPTRYLNKDLSKIFQAIRIEVNDELENLKKCLNDVAGFMETGARIVVISYHSLEDRIIKNFFRSSDELKVITKKPVTSSEKEIKNNIRARSAKLRAAEKR
jgi:16S rRNA (cytosine1402-N4)-methyltransferase